MKLSDIAKEIKQPFDPKKNTEELRYIGLEHISPKTLHLDSYSYTTDVESLKYRFNESDILFGTMRPYFKKIICAPFDGVCSTEIAVIRAKNKLDTDYIFYLMAQNRFIEFTTVNSNGDRPRTKWRKFSKFSINHDSQEIRFRIGKFLSSYDNLIDTNRRRIQLLEESARLLFREWFVYFRFPGHEKVKIVDGVPEEWKREKLNRLVSFLGGHAFKSTSYKQEGKYGIVTIKNVQQSSFVPKCTDYLDDTPDAMKKHCFLTNGDILISLTGNVGRVCLVYGENYLLNQRVAKIEAKKSIPKSFIYWMFDNPIMQKRIENLSFGSAQQNLSPIKLGEQTVIIPPDPLLESFDKIVSLINIEIVQLLSQNQKLTQARDLLLPRLMSGEIEV